MLSNPNINKISPKVGNRYESALALSRRARDIENRRVIEGDPAIKDAVDIAALEIAEGKAHVKMNGEYIIEPEIIKERRENELQAALEAAEEKEEDKKDKKAKKEKKSKKTKSKKQETDEIEE